MRVSKTYPEAKLLSILEPEKLKELCASKLHLRDKHGADIPNPKGENR